MVKTIVIFSLLFMSLTVFAENESRIQNCYSVYHAAVKNTNFDSVLTIEAGRAFLHCQANKEGTLMKKNPDQSSSAIIQHLGIALRQDLIQFSISFGQLIK